MKVTGRAVIVIRSLESLGIPADQALAGVRIPYVDSNGDNDFAVCRG